MDSRERDERAKKGMSEKGEKIREKDKNEHKEHKDENPRENKKSEDTRYFGMAEKYDPSDDSEFDPEADDVNDQLWDPEEEDEDEDEEDE